MNVFNVTSYCFSGVPLIRNTFFPLEYLKLRIPRYVLLEVNACVKGHLKPTHLKSSPLFTFSTKSLGQDSPSVHFFFYNNWVKIHCCENKVGWRFTKLICFLGQDLLSNKQYDKTIKCPFVQDSAFIIFKNKLSEDSPISKYIHLKIRRRDGVESLTLEEGEFKVPIDGCISFAKNYMGMGEEA